MYLCTKTIQAIDSNTFRGTQIKKKVYARCANCNKTKPTKQTKIMEQTIELKIETDERDHIVLINDNGDTFTFNPRKYEELTDFLDGAKRVQ